MYRSFEGERVFADIADVTGTCRQSDNSTNCADSQTVRIAINGVLDPITGTTASGGWSITGVDIFSGDVLTVFVDGVAEANEAVAVTKYDGTGDVSGVELIESHLTIGSDDNATITNADLALYDNSVSGDEDIFFEVDANNDLVVDDEGGHDVKLLLFVGSTYRPDSSGSGNVTTNDFQNDGTFVADGNTIFVSGDWLNTGTFTADTSTVDFNGSGTQSLISGGDSFATVTHSGSGTLQLAGALTVAPTFNNTAGTFDLNGYDWTMTGANLFNDGIVQLRGSEAVTMSTNDTNSGTWRYVGDGAGGLSTFGIISDFAVSGDYYHLIIDADPSETFDIGNTLTVNGDFSVLSGAFDQLVDNVSVSGNLALSDATYTQGSGTLTVDGSLTMTVGSVFDGSDTGAAIDVNGNNVTIAGSFTSTSGTFSFSGQGFGTGGASFLHNNGTVIFDRSGDFAVQTIDGGTFNDFTKSTSDEGQELVFSSANTFTFVGDLILQGGGSNFLTIQGNAGQWTLDAQGGRTVSRLVVRDSNNISDTIDARGTNSSSLGNNFNWLFEGGSFGRVFNDEGVTPLTVTTYTVRVAVNGVDGPSVDINSNGEFDLSGLSFSNGDLLTFYLEDEAPDAVTVILASGTSLDSQVHLYQDRLIARSENPSVPITNAHLTTAWVTGETDAFGNAGDVGIIYQMSSGEITIQSSRELFISSGTNYQPEANVNIGSGGIDINGAFTMGSNLINVSGDWDATGGTSTSSGTVHFNGSGQTIMANEQAFQHVTISGIGIKTITSDFTVNGNLAYNPGGWYVTGSGAMRTISLYGNFSYTAAVGSTFGLSNLTLQMVGTNEQAISKSPTEFFSSPLVIDKPSGSVTLLSNFAINSPFTLTSGDVVLDTFVLTANGATTVSSGTISSSTGGSLVAASSYTQTNGDVTLTGGGTVSVQGDFNISGGTLNTVNFYGAGGALTQSGGTLTDVTIASSGIKTIASDFTVNGNLAYNPTGWYVTGSGAMRTIYLYGNFSYTTGVGATFGLSNLTLRMTGTNEQTISKSAVAFFGAGLVIDKPSGSVGFASDFSFSNPSSVTILDGTLSLNGFSWTMTGISFSNEGILELQGDETITGLTPDINSGTWVYGGDGAAGSTTFTINDFGATDYHNIIIAGDATETFEQEAATVIANTLQVTSGTYAQNGFDTEVNGANTLIIDGGTYEQGDNLLTVEGTLQVLNSGIFNGSNTGAMIDVNGDVDLQVTADTVRLTSGTMTVAGDWTNAMATGFDHNEGTVQFDTSAAAAINGSTVWYNVTIDEATGKTLTFEAGEIQTFETGGTLSATGTSGNLIEFVSSDAGVTQWEITHVDENTGNLSYVSVTDGGCTASEDLHLTDSVNGGNNESCWIFVGGPTVPAAIIDLSAIGANSEVALTWSAPADGGSAITDYIVEYGATAGFPGNAQVFSDGVSASTGATVTGLVNATNYSFRVAAVNAIGTGPYSNIDTATPGAGAGGSEDTDITVDITDFLSFSIQNLSVGDEPSGDQPFGAGAQITGLTTSGSNAYALTGEFGSPVYTQLLASTNSGDGYSVTTYASNTDGRTNALLRVGGTPGNPGDEIPDTLTRLAPAQGANDSLSVSADTGLAFRLIDASTDPSIRETDEDTQWGDNDTNNALWAAFPLGSGAARVIYSTMNFSLNDTVAYINWFVGISASQQSGSYTGQVTFAASVN
ncbi:MAG: beta strand repeat-containing protein [Candidatus Altimarinota bacterium]